MQEEPEVVGHTVGNTHRSRFQPALLKPLHECLVVHSGSPANVLDARLCSRLRQERVETCKQGWLLV